MPNEQNLVYIGLMDYRFRDLEVDRSKLHMWVERRQSTFENGVEINAVEKF